ncbi:MAG TPA: tRNA pseudouridine(55) synthase, partial [Nitrospirae bacterium]|nr:tRNA pseudouridine(55) synthase [Nitrospirota bacterium]
YARQGIDVPRKQRKISIHKIELLDIDLPFAGFTVVCSKGTYIRTLCHDIGKKLGTGAHLFKLERTAIGPFSIKDSLSLEELSPLRKQEGFLNKGVYTMDSALSWMPEYRVTDSQVGDVQNGVPVSISGSQDFLDSLAASSGIRVKSPEGLLLAIGSFQPIRKTVKMDVVFG